MNIIFRDFIIILFVIIIIYYYNNIYEQFTNENYIISIYSPIAGFGFGDYIRGLIYLYQKTDKKIIADYRTHIISNFLYNDLIDEYPIYNDNYVIKLEETIDNNNKIIISHNNIFNDSNNHYIITNFFYENNLISQDIINNIKKTFTMKPEFKLKFENKLDEYNLNSDFVALHIRLDDKYFKDDDINLPYFGKLYYFIDNTFSSNDKIFILSNCKKIKDQICDKYKFIIQYPIKPIHTIDDSNNILDMENTLIEFFTLSRANKIYYFCDNDWQISGFSKRISEMYQIEYIQIK